MNWTVQKTPRRSGPGWIALVTMLSIAAFGFAPARAATDAAVACQIQLEEVRWRHRVWPDSNPDLKPDRADILPDEVIRRRVEERQRREEVLQHNHGLVIDAPMLDAELHRMIAKSRMPKRLEELFEALGHDSERINECLVRPVLIDRHYERLVNGYAGAAVVSNGLDDGTHSDAPTVNKGGTELSAPRSLSTSAEDQRIDAWRTEDFPDGRRGHSAVWTGSVMVIWGGWSGGSVLDTGSRYDPVTDTWSGISTVDAPSPRQGHATVWTGSEMLVWGGQRSGTTQFNDGGRYDPVADRWTPMSLDQAPAARSGARAVWTGAEMIVWGGGNVFGPLPGGARYSPASDQWQAISDQGEPPARHGHSAVWTGGEMLVWGGRISGIDGLADGARYNPQVDAWEAIESNGAPSARFGHTAVWTGTEMIVWGGRDADAPSTSTGGRYNPATDSWIATEMDGAPAARIGHGAVWSGREMLIWGGGWPLHDLPGGRYDPVSNSWSSVSQTGAPPGSEQLGLVWTGEEMIVWGGLRGSAGQVLNSGGRYDPTIDGWRPINDNGAPRARNRHVSVWTGTEKLVWGGDGKQGSRYDPVIDQWTPMATVDAPDGRIRQTAVWTGTEMIIWGGVANSRVKQTGARYNPTTDIWTPTGLDGAPAARMWHSAVWSGARMLIWGGDAGLGSYLNDGASYDPSSDSWEPLPSLGAPESRVQHSAFWTGSEMLIWGGRQGLSQRLDTGALLDPASKTWRTTNMEAAPAARYHHSAVWTGDEMIVWGGNTGQLADARTGARYDPLSDTWQATATEGAPSRRQRGQATVWTGSEMIVWSGWSALLTPTGGRYDPLADRWQPTSLRGVSAQRDGASAEWTGDGMLVWGGHTNSVGLYFPDTAAPGPQLRVAAASSAPVRVGEPVVIFAEVYDEFGDVPQDGQLEIRADSGESCLDPGPPAADKGVAVFACEMVFSGPGLKRLTASFEQSATAPALDTFDGAFFLEVLDNGLYRLGGRVSRLFGSGLTLRNNLGELLPLDTEGSFLFDQWLPDGATWAVDVVSQPVEPDQVCTVVEYAGRIAGADAIELLVACESDFYRVGGHVRGLEGSGLVLQNNGGDDLAISGDGSFYFDTALAEGSGYDVTVASQPVNPKQTCAVDSGSGQMTAQDVQEILVECITEEFLVGVSSTEGGIVNPDGTVVVEAGAVLTVELLAEPGFVLDAVGGSCGGALDGNRFITEPVNADCTVDAEFVPVDTRSLRFVRTPAVGIAELAVRPRVEVEIRTANGERDLSDDGTVIVLSLTGGHPDAVLSGTVAVEASAGLAVFEDLVIDLAGRDYQLLARDMERRLEPSVSGRFRVVPDR